MVSIILLLIGLCVAIAMFFILFAVYGIHRINKQQNEKEELDEPFTKIWRRN